MFDRTQMFQEKTKAIFDKKTKPEDFQVGDMVLRWDAVHEDKGKHRKFDHLWKGTFKVRAFVGNNAYMLEEVEGGFVSGAPVNGRFLKHYFVSKFQFSTPFVYISFYLIFYKFECFSVRHQARGQGRKSHRVAVFFLFYFF